MRLAVGTARSLVRSLLVATTMPEASAARTAEAIVLADCWGVGSHGLMRLPHYLRRLRAGGYPPRASLDLISDTGPLLSYDGNGGLGHWQLWGAAEEATTRCSTFGVAVAGVANSGHCGALGVYTLPALERGHVALVLSNGPAVMPAWGGRTPLLSTSPLAAGIPCRPRPVIVDMATSATARGRLLHHLRAGEELPEGLALDAEGRPTVDPRAALEGMLAPLGGAKGFALALLVEGLTGGMVGPCLSAEVADMFDPEDDRTPQGIGHLVVVVDPAWFDGPGGHDAATRLDLLASRVVMAGGRLPGTGRRQPREIADGELLDLPDELVGELRDWCERLAVDDSMLTGA